jgi:hypothetical protein
METLKNLKLLLANLWVSFFNLRNAHITGRTFYHYVNFFIIFNVKIEKTNQQIQNQFILFCKRKNILLKKFELINLSNG